MNRIQHNSDICTSSHRIHIIYQFYKLVVSVNTFIFGRMSLNIIILIIIWHKYIIIIWELYSHWISTKGSIPQGAICLLIRTEFLDFVWHWNIFVCLGCQQRTGCQWRRELAPWTQQVSPSGFSSLLWHESHKLADQVKPAFMWLVELKPLSTNTISWVPCEDIFGLS